MVKESHKAKRYLHGKRPHKGERYIIRGEVWNVTNSEYDEKAKEYLCTLRRAGSTCDIQWMYEWELELLERAE